MSDFVGFLRLLTKSDLEDIAKKVLPAKVERNKFCQDNFSKCFSRLDKILLSRLISSHITIYDLDKDKLRSIYDHFFNRPALEGASSRQIIRDLRERKISSTLENNVEQFSVLFIGISCTTRKQTSDDFNELKTVWGSNISRYQIELLPTHREETCFQVRDFFERNSTSDTFLVVLSGHGSTSGALQLSAHSNFSIEDILRQWHNFACKPQQPSTLVMREQQPTLVLVCDYCYSGSAIEDVKNWGCSSPCCQRIIVHTSCAADQLAYEGIFIPAMVDMLRTPPNNVVTSARTIPDKCFENGWRMWNDREEWEPDGLLFSYCCNCKQTVYKGYMHHCRVCKRIVCRACKSEDCGVKLCGREDCQVELRKSYQTPMTYARHSCGSSFQVKTQDNVTLDYYLHNADDYRTIWTKWIMGKGYSLFEKIVLGGPKPSEPSFEYLNLADSLPNQPTANLQYGKDDTLLDSCRRLVETINEERNTAVKRMNNVHNGGAVDTLLSFRIQVEVEGLGWVEWVDVAIKLCDTTNATESQYYVKAVKRPNQEKWLVDKRRNQNYNAGFLDKRHSLNDLEKAMKVLDSTKIQTADNLFDLCGVFGVEVLRFVDIAKEITIIMNDDQSLACRDRKITFPKPLITNWHNICSSGRRSIEIGLHHPKFPSNDLLIAEYSENNSLRFHLYSIREHFLRLSLTVDKDEGLQDVAFKLATRMIRGIFPKAAERIKQKQREKQLRNDKKDTTAAAEAK